MRLTRLSIRNYRCLESLDLNLDDYTALVGANGAGKSSVLYALDWFFAGREIDASDLTLSASGDRAESMQVTAVFSDLTPLDRSALGAFGRGELATFTRRWSVGEKRSSVQGEALGGPGFEAVRGAGTVPEMRKQFRALVAAGTLKGLAGNAPKEDMLKMMSEWESDPANQTLLEPDQREATELFSGGALADRVRFVLVPASTDMSQQLGSIGRGSMLADLVGSVVADAGAEALRLWLERQKEEVASLSTQIRSNVDHSVRKHSERINLQLQRMIPGASIQFHAETPEWTPKIEPTVSTDVRIDGSTAELSRQGHGVQRAVMIALLQAMNDFGEPRFADPSEPPALIICVEEPEIYQHPVRARSLSRILGELSERPGAQVVVATHSPYFVPPNRFSSMRRFVKVGHVTRVLSTSIEQIAESVGVDVSSVKRAVEKRLPTTFSEGFFADAAVLVEGETDKAVVEALGEKVGRPFDQLGILILEVGSKESLKIPLAILESLGVKTFLIADADSTAAQRRYPHDEEKRIKARGSHESSTAKLVKWLPQEAPLRGSAPYVFGAPSLITNSYVIWQDDIEGELANWASYVEALECDLREKSAYNYRAAVADASISDLPNALRDLATVITSLTGQPSTK